jgi:hypothetical protein
MARSPVTSRVIDLAAADPARSSHGPPNGGGRDDEGTDRVIDYAEVATSYIAMWNATDEQDRAKLVAGLCTDDARYVDPMVVAEGSEAIAATIAGAQQQFPGWTFRLAGPVDGHHNQTRFTWEFGPAGVDTPVAGFDVALLTDEGKVVAVYGFLDKVPAAL